MKHIENLIASLLVLVAVHSRTCLCAATPEYEQAYEEMAAMLDGQQPLSIRRAVFLAEQAYYDGQLDYEKYCRTIDSAADFLRRFIAVNGFDQYKTGKNMALVEYFFNPYSGNGYRPFTYEYDQDRSSFERQFVTPLMETHRGQCRSLPMYYRILAEAIDAEAYIVRAPLHTFIRYRNEDGRYPEPWVNVELTTHQIIPTFHIKEHYGITDKAIEGKIYLYELSARETVALQLADLAFGYASKYRWYDSFTLRCTEKALEYYPYNPNAMIIKGKSLTFIYFQYLLTEGGSIDDPYAVSLARYIDRTSQQLNSSGWEKISDEVMARLEEGYKHAEQVFRQQQQSENNH